MAETQTSHVCQLAQMALQANKEHQRALKAYIEKLEGELKAVEELINSADVGKEEEPGPDVGGFVHVPGAIRATSAISPTGLLSLGSPFRDDALRRTRYKSLTGAHPMKSRELEALAEGVRTENYRKLALEAQLRGLSAFSRQSPKALELNREGLDWDRIAEKVSSVSTTTRTARECEIRWLGDRHPDFNHGPWDQEEIDKLRSLISEHPPSWVDVARELGTNRTPLDCMRHGTTRRLHVWTTESDQRLLTAVHIYGNNNWSLVARYVSEDATPTQCSNRHQRVLDPSVKRSKWTPAEDARLRVAVAAYGESWIEVAATMPGRTNDQCRDRWNDQLSPTINKSVWGPEEDKKLLDVKRENEAATWKTISEILGSGRTDSMCRNRYKSLQRGSGLASAKFIASHHSLARSMPVTPTAVSSRTSTATPPGHQSHSLGPLPSDAPFHEEFQSQNEGPPLLFLEPVVSSDPALCQPRHAKPLAPPGSASNIPAPSPSRASSLRKGKKRRADANNGNGEDVPPKRRPKTAQPRRAGMEGQVIVTFCPAATGDTRPSTST